MEVIQRNQNKPGSFLVCCCLFISRSRTSVSISSKLSPVNVLPCLRRTVFTREIKVSEVSEGKRAIKCSNKRCPQVLDTELPASEVDKIGYVFIARDLRTTSVQPELPLFEEDACPLSILELTSCTAFLIELDVCPLCTLVLTRCTSFFPVFGWVPFSVRLDSLLC